METMLNDAFRTGQESLKEGHALLDAIRGTKKGNTDSMMGDKTTHKKRGVPDTTDAGDDGDY
jgi:hypothetical protein